MCNRIEREISMPKGNRDMHPESSARVNRRAFLEVAAGAVTGAAIAGGIPEIAAARKSESNHGGGPLYMQTNEIQNAIIYYRRDAKGALTEVERVLTGGAGSGTFKPISGQQSAPNAFEGASSVILTPDRQLLFTTNGGDNSVSSFRLGKDRRLTRLDVKPTGNAVEGKSGTAKSLAYAPAKGMLYVLHSFGPDHLRLMSVDAEGTLTTRPERYTVNTQDKTDRVPTMAVLSPDGKFLLVGTTFDRPIAHTGTYPDGSPILWVQQPDGKFKSIASNAPDPDGLVVFPVRHDGTLGAAKFQDAKAGSPFYITFLILLSQKVATNDEENHLFGKIHTSAMGVLKMDLPRSNAGEARFSVYVDGLTSVIGHADRAKPLRDYCLGLMMPCERKSVEPIAAITAPKRTAAQHQSLLHFIGEGGWSDEKVLAKVRELVLPRLERHGPIEAWIIDDTSFPKKGQHS